MAAGNIKISPDEMREASTWLQNQKEMMQQSLQEANTKMEELVEAAYATPGSETKFRPYWEEYKSGTQEAIEGLQGVSQFIQQVADAFVDTTSSRPASSADFLTTAGFRGARAPRNPAGERRGGTSCRAFTSRWKNSSKPSTC
ncbi:WXG100 family type VII secretion target [Streptomyces sp. NPDC048644]|uniref:WXG100 family type VII secretion target n=1 Tax=Streptomyces sp. NPDC048644 TaxID=3365582 RepID=UPI0037138608